MTSAPRRSARDWVVDIAFVSLAALLALGWAADGITLSRFSPGYVVLSLLLAAIGCGALWWRRRWPIGVAVLLLPLSLATEALGVAVLIAVFTVATRRPWRMTLAIATAHFLAMAPMAVIRPDPAFQTIGTAGLNFALLAAVVGWGTVVRTRRELVASLRERAARAEAEAGLRADRLRGLERERIAREMHDVLAHRLSLVSLHAGALEVRPDLPTAEVARVAGTIRASAHQALEDLREILGVLRADGAAGLADPGHGPDAGLRPQPGLGDLAALIAETRAAGTPVSLDDRLGDAPAPPGAIARTAYRVVQEGLTNARKHAPGEEVRLCLAGAPGGHLHVALRNRLPVDPRPPVPPGSRSGLLGLAERVDLTGGRIDHGARRGEGGVIGFHLEAWLPWPT